MAHWNYRVIRRHHEASDETTYQIHEVYYDDKNTIEHWTVSPVEPMGESLAELREDVRYFLRALEKPVLFEITEDGKELLVADDERPVINNGHFPELLDRVWVATEYLHQFLGSHPLCKTNDELRGVYSKAEEALSELYQRIGGMIE